MKPTLLLLLALALGLNLALIHSARAEDNHAAAVVLGTIHFQNARPEQALSVYQKLTQLKLVMASNVHLAKHGIYLDTPSVSKAEAQQALEQALLKQAGVIITPLDDGTASVTYNDQLVKAK